MKVCPSCEIKLTPAELAAGRCDICGASLVNLAPTGTPEGHDDSPHMSSREVLGWGTTRTGILSLILGTCFQFFALVIAGLVAWRAGTESLVSPEGIGNCLAMLTALVFAVWGEGGQLMGFLFCMGVPSGTGARKWSVSAFVFGMIYLAVWLIFIATMSGSESSSMSAIQERLSGAATFLSLIGSLALLAVLTLTTWVLFLARVARLVGKEGLATGAIVFLVAVLMFATGTATLSGLAANEVFAVSPRLMTIILAIGGLVLGIWHLVMLMSLRVGITRLIER